ncbi:MAG: transporter, partial [Candidatus Acidiferrales bacterium]
MRIKLLTALVFLLVFSAVPVNAQQKGQYIPGQQGLNAGLLPDPGFTYANLTINYSADTLKNGNGNTVPLTGSYDIWAVANVFYYVPKFKFLGAKLAFMVAPTLANGSLTLGSLRFPNIALNARGEGLADLWVQPLTLGWSLKRVDVYAGYAFMAPTGRYSAGASDNVGSGYWGNHFITGSTFYITKNKGTTANLFTDWEFHGSRATGAGTNITPGQAFTTEWGIGQVLPLKKDFTRLLQLGVIGYDQWQ